MRQKSNGKQQFVIKRAAGSLLLIFAFTGIIGICVEKKDNRIRADSGMETERMAEENTKAASGKIKEEEVKKVALTFDKSGSYGDTFGRFERAECEGNFFSSGCGV